jgi:hypothetical protein
VRPKNSKPSHEQAEALAQTKGTKTVKYMWADPLTGLREQDDSLESATLRAWTELQDRPDGSHMPLDVTIYETWPIGTAERNGGRFIHTQLTEAAQFCWCSPTDGKLVRTDNLKTAKIEWPDDDLFTSVTIHGCKEAATVRHDDLKPLGDFLDGPALEAPASLHIPTLAELREKALKVPEAELFPNCDTMAKIQILALLSIAESLGSVAESLKTFTENW